MNDEREPYDGIGDAGAPPDEPSTEPVTEPSTEPVTESVDAAASGEVPPHEQAAEPAVPDEAPAADAEFETPPMSDLDAGREYDQRFEQSVAHEPPPPEVEAYTPTETEERAATASAHTVPATGVGESTRCPRCGTENRPGIAFCRECGQRLVAAGVAATVERPGAPEGTQACPRCGTHNRAGVAFCQNCGANLRGTAATEAGYVPPAVQPAPEAATDVVVEPAGHAVLGPVVLLIAAIGIATAWLLPFAYGSGSLYERAFGAGGYGAGFWAGYGNLSGIIDKAYFGVAAASPVLVALLVVLAIAGIARARPGGLQMLGLVVALLWCIGLAVLFGVVEIGGGLGSDLAGLLRNLTPGGIIFLLASLIGIIGTLTRMARG